MMKSEMHVFQGKLCKRKLSSSSQDLVNNGCYSNLSDPLHALYLLEKSDFFADVYFKKQSYFLYFSAFKDTYLLQRHKAAVNQYGLPLPLATQ